MDRSGTWVSGSGEYVWGEIAPPIESGQLLLNNKFENWTGDDPDDWSVSNEDVVNYITEVSSGARMVSDGSAAINMSNSNTVIIGRSYHIKIYFSSISGGVRLFLSTGTGLLEDITTVGLHEFTFVPTATASIKLQRVVGGCDAIIDWVTIEEVPEGYPLMDKGMKYLENTVAGTVAFPSDQAYGEWEFDWYKGVDTNSLVVMYISPNHNLSSYTGTYGVQISNDEQIRIIKNGSAIMRSAVSYIDINTWYKIKITRTLDGEFYFYIKGGSFRVNDWTLIDYSILGTNPIIDTTYVSSKYFLLDLDAGDRIANIQMKKAVQQ